MTTKEYFSEQLIVSFTMSELFEISSALATESFEQSTKNLNANAEKAWELRKKVGKYIDIYKGIYK